MKIIIDFPDDIPPKYYQSVLEHCGSMIKEPKHWKTNITGITIKDEPFLIECRKQKNISFKIKSKSRCKIKIEIEKQKKRWEVEKCNV